MAFTSIRAFVNMRFIDKGLNETRKRVQLPGVTTTDAIANAAAIVPLFAAVSASYIVSYTYEEEFVNDAAGYPPSSDAAENSTRALLTVALTNIPKKASLEVPAPLDAIFGAAGTSGFNIVDLSNVNVKALVNAFNSGQFAYISDEEYTLNTADGGLVAGKRIHRGSTNG